MIFVTHDLADACALGDAIAVIDGGRIVQTGPPREILYRPASPVVARLTGLRNVFPARVTAAHDGGLEVATDRFCVRTPPYPFPAGAAVDLYVRPEHVVLVRPEHEGDPRRPNLVRGRIVDELHLGPIHTLYFRLRPGPPGPAAPSGPSAGSRDWSREREPGREAGEAPSLPGWAPPRDAGYDLEVDLAAHPYQALRVAQRREWLLSLTPEALHLAAPQGRAGPYANTPGAAAALDPLQAAPDSTPSATAIG
jgi:hypothetical protein